MASMGSVVTQRRRWLVRLIGVWLTLTVVSTAAHRVAWRVIPDPDAPGATALEWIAKPLDNLAQTCNGPAWLFAWRVVGHFQSSKAALLANGAGWAAWVGLAAAVWELRRRLGRRGGREPAAARPTDEAVADAGLSRRRFLTDATLAAGALTAAGSAGAATLVTPWSLTLRRYSVAIKDLPRGLNGLRLVHLSDTHLGPRIPAPFIRHAVAQTLSLRPDLVVLVGDYVHMGARYIEEAAALFAPLTEPGAVPGGVVGVLGNHDHYADAPGVTRALARVGVRMIDNDRVFLDGRSRRVSEAVPAGPALCLAGLGDLLEGLVDPARALDGVPAEMPRVVLAHNPDTAEIGSITGAGEGGGAGGGPPRRIDLMLCGHTHGGQVRLPGLGTPIVPSRHGSKYAHGLVRGPVCPVLVSAGVGMSVVPVRLGVPPEIVEVTLVGS